METKQRKEMTAEELQDEINERFESFLKSICDDERFVRPIDEEYDSCGIEDCEFIYKERGMRLIENFKERMSYIFYKHFPDDEDFEIESQLYQED